MAKNTDSTKYVARLLTDYQMQYVEQLMTDLKLTNVMETPKLEKIVLAVGLGRGKDDKKLIETATNTLKKITGLTPVPTYAKKSVATFKLREGNMIGLKVTLRGNYMYEFMDRLINIVMPRIRDFHGVKLTAFDKQGNYNIGLVDQSIFPELSFEETSPSHGLQVVFVIKSKDVNHAQALLTKFGMPFNEENN